MYQSECSPKWIRGAVVSGYQWAITIGLLLASVINNATKDRDDHSAWRIPTGIQLIWAFILTVGMLWLPEVSAFIFATLAQCSSFPSSLLVSSSRRAAMLMLPRHFLA